MNLNNLLNELPRGIRNREFTDFEKRYVDMFNDYTRARIRGDKDKWLADHSDEERLMVKTWASYVANVRSKNPDASFEEYAKTYKPSAARRRTYTTQEKEYVEAYNEYVRASRKGNKEEFLRNLKRTDPDKLLKIKAWANYNLNVRRKNPNLKFADYIKTYRPYNIPNPPGRQLSLFDDEV